VITDTKKNGAFELGVQLAVSERYFFILTDGMDQFDVEDASGVKAYLQLHKFVYKKSKGRLCLGISLGTASFF
jgi:hypothetical protein